MIYDFRDVNKAYLHVIVFILAMGHECVEDTSQ